VTLKSGLEVTQGYWNWCHSKAWMWSTRLTIKKLRWTFCTIERLTDTKHARPLCDSRATCLIALSTRTPYTYCSWINKDEMRWDVEYVTAYRKNLFKSFFVINTSYFGQERFLKLKKQAVVTPSSELYGLLQQFNSSVNQSASLRPEARIAVKYCWDNR